MKKLWERKWISLLLAVVLTLSLLPMQAFADDQTGAKTVQEVIDLIDAAVAADEGKEDKIKAARESYNSLSEDDKTLVTNYNSLLEAEQALLAPGGYLSELKIEDSKGNAYEMTADFSGAPGTYCVVIPERQDSFVISVQLSENAPEGSVVTAKYKNLLLSSNQDKEKQLVIGSGNSLSGVVTSYGENSSVTLEVGTGDYRQIYAIKILRSNPTVDSIKISDASGENVTLNESFSGKDSETVYTADTASEYIIMEATPRNSSYTVFYNGSTDGTILLNAGENLVSLTVKNTDGYETVYNFNINRKGSRSISFSMVPSGAVVYLTNRFGTRIWPDENGVYSLADGETYSYNVTKNGYIGKNGTLTVSKDETVFVSLKKAEENSLINFEAAWPSFGYNRENNIVIDYPTPLKLEETALYWANRVGDGYGSGATGVPILVDDYLYTYAGTKIVKVDKMSGEIVAAGTMDRNSDFAINSPTYAEGMIFVGLSNGCVQAFNAETLESLWIYEDKLGGQPNSQIAYDDGYIYTGFWNSETADANFVCVSVTDEDPENPKEEKLASWTYTQAGGFYWAGAYVEGDYVYVGTDDGASGYTTGYAHLISFDKISGKVISNVTMPNVGDIRSSITCSDGRLYFTSKGGYFYEAEFESDTGKIGTVRDLKLENGSDEPSSPAMSTSTPTVYNGRAYIGVSGVGQFAAYSGHNITVIDIASWEIAYNVPTQGYPQTTGTLTTAYEEETGYVYVYFFDNYTPGKLRILKDKPGLREPLLTVTETANGTEHEVAPWIFAPTGSLAEYCICTPIIDSDGTLYFKNDSAYIMAVGSAVEKIEVTKNPNKMSYEEGDVFDPTGMEVTAYYVNGTKSDITKYVTYSKEPLSKADVDFQIRYEQVGSDKIPFDVIKLSFEKSGVIVLEEEKTVTGTGRITLTDTIKLDGETDEGTLFTDKAAGGTFYVAVISDVEFEDVELVTTGYLSGQLLDFDPEKYRSTGKETYSVYNRLNPGEGIKGGTNLQSYDQALKIAEKLNTENRTTAYKVKCDQYMYVAKITVPQNYGVSYKSGTYKITASIDGKAYTSAEYTVVSDVSIFEYEYLKYSAGDEHALSVQGENARGYSDYLTAKYGYSYEKAYDNQSPTVISTTAFRAIRGKMLNVQCGNNVLIEISEISESQKGVNFIFSNPNGKEEENNTQKKAANYSLTFYGTQQIMSDYKITWDLGCSYFELREKFKIKLEENDVITYYITKNGEYFDEFTVDYANADYNDEVVITINGEAGTTLGAYRITTVKPAEKVETEENPNTGAPVPKYHKNN